MNVDSIGATRGELRAAPAAPGGRLGKQEFLTMLVAQLKNQDPMNPMQSDQLASQLAQFSSLEELTNIGKVLEVQTLYQQAFASGLDEQAAVGMIGKTVLAHSDQIEFGSEPAVARFGVSDRGGLVRVRLFDTLGREVGVQELGMKGQGMHEVDLSELGSDLLPGTYRFVAEVTDAAGRTTQATPFTAGKVDGVRYGADGPILTIGGRSVRLDAVVRVGS